jgi:hypothetical protein
LFQRYSLKVRIIVFKIIDVGSNPAIRGISSLNGKTMAFEAKIIGSIPMRYKGDVA